MKPIRSVFDHAEYLYSEMGGTTYTTRLLFRDELEMQIDTNLWDYLIRELED